MPRTPNITAVQRLASLAGGPEPSLLGSPPHTHTTTSPPTRRRQFQSPQLGRLPVATPFQLPGCGPSCLEGAGFSPQEFFLLGLPLQLSPEGSGPCPVCALRTHSPRSRASLPTWTAGVPAAPAGSRSVPSARPVSVAASSPGCGPHPAGVNGTENMRISLGGAASLSHFPCSVLEPCLIQLSCLISILAGHQPPGLPSTHRSTQDTPKCLATQPFTHTHLLLIRCPSSPAH